MLSTKHRFHGYNSLRYVYKNGQTVRGPLFALKYLSNDRRSDWRLAVVVSRKVCKSAVKRNRIRRRLFESARQLNPSISGPYDIVITVFHESLREISPKELNHMLKKQLAEAGIIKPKS